MAAEVGLALLIASLDVLFDRLASPELLKFIKGKRLDQRLLKRFETKLDAVRALLNDAEQKQFKDPAVKKWVDALKDAVYEADDLLDELSTRAATQKEVRKFFNINFKDRKMEIKIEEIIQRLEEIEKQKVVLRLENIAGKMLTQRPKSTSLLVESDVYGREKDREAIIELLLSDDISDGKKIGVIPIVGLGGIGKTTLAQLVYNDDRVKQKFNLRAWVCVSNDFDVWRIMTNIMEEVSGETCNKENPDLLQIQLQERLKGKNFLIVLDDVWTERYTDWDPLRPLFHHGHEGSKIIVTTRSTKAASKVNTTPSYCLDTLSDKDCWSIFVRHASPSEHSISNSFLEEVRDDIIRKCKGLPLAAKMLGGVLRSQSDVKNWKIVLKNGTWDSSESEDKSVLTLRVSYYYLPSPLKRCFIYCSLFPKDFAFEKEELILLWMAEGLLHPTDKNMTLEEVGCAYFEELTSRFFFQPSNNSEEIFVMHDLIHDLAESFAGEFYCKVQNGGGNNIGNKTRHISYSHDECDLAVSMFEAINNSKALRTFLSLSQWRMASALPKDLRKILLSNCKCLRVLSLMDFKSLEVLPNSIGELIHLRYLNLSGTDIISLPDLICKLRNLQTLKLEKCYQLTKLPNSIGELIHLRYLDLSYTYIISLPDLICKLHNLQTLKLERCNQLTKLPNSIGELIHLCYLDLSRTLIISLPGPIRKLHNLQTLKLRYCRQLTKLPDDIQDLVNLRYLDVFETNIQDMPMGMGKLKNLHYLSDFVVGKDKGSQIGELGGLSDLANTLAIQKLQNVSNKEEVSQAEMMDKKYIEKLELHWGTHDADDSQTEKDILEKLKPHTNLKDLLISGYMGTRFSCWLGHHSYSNMNEITLKDCKNCCSLPPLGQLPYLKVLSVMGFEMLVTIDDGFYKSSDSSLSTAFPSLESLSFANMHAWKEWCLFEKDAFPLLRRLVLGDCPKIVGDLPKHLPALEELVIDQCQQLASPIPRAPLIHTLEIEENEELILQPEEKPLSLKQLIIRNCEKLEFLKQICCESLVSLQITASRCSLDFSSINTLPNLQRLHIDGCGNLKSVSVDTFPNLQSLYIYYGCENLKSVSVDTFDTFPNLQSLCIFRCRNLESVSVDTFPNLSWLFIDECENLKSVSVSSASLQKLRDVVIFDCCNLEDIQTKGNPPPNMIPWNVICCPKLKSSPICKID